MTRYAIYYAPEGDDPLWAAGCAWLGRDPAGGPIGAPPLIDDIAEITANARAYGFHATLKPPMRLRDGFTRDHVLATLRDVAASVPRFTLPPLAMADFHGFLCLRETSESAALQALSDAAVAGLDHLRAPPDAAELAKRRAGSLPAACEANLRRWGYPDVFATWFFHMTLSRRLPPERMAAILPVAETWFASALNMPREVRSVCLFEQPAGEAFSITERVALAA